MTHETSTGEPVSRNSREFFEPLGFDEVTGGQMDGSPGADVLRADAPAAVGTGLPGAVAFWSFADGTQGEFADARGGSSASAYRQIESQAVLQTQTPTRNGPDGTPDGAMEFNGETSFGFIAHDPVMEVTQGTVSLWVQPDDIEHDSIILSKDQSGAGEGGHFRLGIEDDGRIFVRFAQGDGGNNHAWTSSQVYFSEGQWTHVAVSFTEDGITVYADGVAIPDYAWYREEGRLDSPAHASEAYLLQNSEPWILGADTSRSKNNNTPEEFAADHEDLHDAFDGAIAQFGLWGGNTPEDALDAGQVLQLFSEGPGDALTAPSGPQPMLAGDDMMSGGAGNDHLDGGAGDDHIKGDGGSDVLSGGYGDDILEGGADDDVLDGGRGSDLLLGGDGNDTLVSRSDAGEQRIGQLAIGQPTRPDPDNQVNELRQKLYGWEDQPLVADDILVGGAGADTFLFNPQINAKRDIILEHVNADRTIDWAGVAGENNALHDHWVDSFGIDVIADYRAGEDSIVIVGHTATPEVEHRFIDTDGDEVPDEMVSIVSVYSNQGNGGGAHTQDLIGQFVVHGDLVDLEDIKVEAGVTHGIVDTVDELREALAPSGERKESVDAEGNLILGYDTRDGDSLGAIVNNPQDFIDNPYLDSDLFELEGNVPPGVPGPVAVMDERSHPQLDAMQFSGNAEQGVNGAYVNVPHTDELARTTGTIAFNFAATAPGAGNQALFSKDARGYEDGGHLTAWVTDHACVEVRYQSTDSTVYLKSEVILEAGRSYHFTFSFDGDSATLYLDGVPQETENLSRKSGYEGGMSGNSESLVFGAATTHRDSGELNNLKQYFKGSIDEVVVVDRALYDAEVFKLFQAGGDFDEVGADSSNPPGTPADQGLPESLDPDATDNGSNADARPVPTVTGTGGNDDLDGDPGNDLIHALAGDDGVDGQLGMDTITGGYGNDRLQGGDGNDIMMGGRGSDLLIGGAGDDLLITRSDAGEQRIGQLAIGQPSRPDPDGEVNPERQKLYGWENQPLVGDDILIGGAGADTFLISPQINAKREIIEKHARDDGSIRWNKVAGENNELHDHWVDSIGIDVIADYNASEDHIAIIGHTVAPEIEYRDVDQDGDEESIITIYSQQGNNGGAHDEDLIGQVIVHGDRVDEEDIVIDAGVTYGIVENIADIEEAINPQGVAKVSTGPRGEEILGYDTRDDNGNLGAIVSNPEDYIDNPFLDEVSFAAPGEVGPNYSSREFFEPLGFDEVTGGQMDGSPGADVLRADTPAAVGTGLPGAVAFWSFADGAQGEYGDARDGPSAVAYELYENQAVLQTQTPTRNGPDGTPDGAMEFNGETSFGFIAHDPAMEVTQGTVSLWVQPDDIEHDSIILSKDQSGAGEGGHFRLGIEDDGRIFVRFAQGDGGSNHAWTSSQVYFNEGQWTHVAVSFTEDGITVYADGVAIPDYAWYREEGRLDSPAHASEAYLLQNSEPWILGANTSHTKHNDTAAEFATDEEHLCDAFDGAIAQLGLWGGNTPEDALDAGQVLQLFSEGPGDALTAPSGPQPMLAGDDMMSGGAGNDHLDGGAGDDHIKGDGGSDVLSGGYGDDILEGGADDDVLDGGRGSDLLLGGDGNDTLVSRSDAGEQRIGQLAIGQPTRGDPDNEVNELRQKLYGWEDQPLKADDILVGGAGADTFLFNPQINAKRDIILEHVNPDRTIDWAGVAGENNELHEHWVDSFGIDVIADYRAGEDSIVIVGHTATPEVEHRFIDTDGDEVPDEVVSIVSVYSNQGNGGGAHTQDLIGQFVVHGDLVDLEDIKVEAGVTHGIVDTVDELREALAPSGERKESVDAEGNLILGYDTRDGDSLGAIVSNPQDFIDNPYLDSKLFELEGNVPPDVPDPVAVMDELSHPQLDAMQFSGNAEQRENGAYVNIPHSDALALAMGTIAFSFVADAPGMGYQALFSKDARGYEDGGHLTAWITDGSEVKVRYQSTDETVYLRARDVDIVAGRSYHLAVSFDAEGATLYIDGMARDSEDLSGKPNFAAGLGGNSESLLLGASATHRTSGELNNLRDHFKGGIDDLVVVDRVLYDAEVFKLSEGLLEITGTADDPPVDDPPVDDPPVDDPPVDDPPVDDPPVDDPPVDDPPVDDPPVDDPPVDDPPVDDPPVDDPPVDDPPVDDPPVDDPPVDDPPVDDPPVDDPPVDDPPVDDPPVDDPPVDDPPVDEPPVDDPPVDDPPVDDPPVDDPPVDDPPVDDPPVDDPPVDDPPVDDPPVDDPPVDDPPVDDPPVDDPPVDDPPVDDPPVDDPPVDDPPVDDPPVDDPPVDDPPVDDPPVDDPPVDDPPVDDPPVDDPPVDDPPVDDPPVDDPPFDDPPVEDQVLMGTAGEDNLVGGSGNDQLLGVNGDDVLSGDAGDDVILAGAGDDQVSGGAGNDVLLGSSGADGIRGGAGNDFIAGGEDDDLIEGGSGNDIMFGQRGADRFVFDTPEPGETLGMDVIRDFRSGEDQLQISSDLIASFDSLSGFTRMTLTDSEGAEVGTVSILGGEVDESLDLVRVPASDSTDGDLLL